MGLALTLQKTAENEKAWDEKLSRGISRRGRSDIKSIEGWEDQPSIDEWAKVGVTFTNKGLEFAAEITKDIYVSVGAFCGMINNGSKLWIGDWAAYGQRRWGYSRSELADMTGLDPETIDNYISIGLKVPVSNRIAGLSPRHYAAVASVDRGMQAKLLKIAADNDWASDLLRNKKKAVIEFGAPLNNKPVFASDLKQMAEDRAAELAGQNGSGQQSDPVTRTLRHSDEYKLALLRDVESLSELFEVDIEQDNTEIEITLVGGLDHLLALLSAELPDELMIGIKVSEVCDG